jgi:hypothetical protein
VLRLTGTNEVPPVALSVDECAAIATSKTAAVRGEFASDEQVRAAWAKHGEAPLHPSGTCRPQHGPRLHRGPFAARRAACSGAPPGDHPSDLLLLCPGIGTRTDDRTIRRTTAQPYPCLIFHEATEPEIIVHAVRHAVRDPAGMPSASQAD